MDRATLRFAVFAIPVLCLWAACRNIPPPRWLFGNTDFGYILAAGRAIVHDGRWPFADFFTNYGPGIFLVPGLLTGWVGGRLVLFFAFVVLCQFFSYLGIAFFAFRHARHWAVGAMVLLASMHALVEPYYFWMQLAPVGYLIFLERALSSGRRWSLPIGLAVMSAVVFLFRHDFGTYFTLTSLLVIFVSGTFKDRAIFAFGFLGTLAPWIALMAAKHAVRSWLSQLFRASFVYPFKRPDLAVFSHSDYPVLEICYFSAILILVFAGIICYRSRKSRSPDRTLLLASTSLSALTLIYGCVYRGLWHLGASLTSCLLLLPLLDEFAQSARIRVGVRLVAALLSLSLVCAYPFGLFSRTSFREKVSSFLRQPYAFAMAAGDPESRQVLSAIRSCTDKSDAIVCLPDFLGFSFYSDRPFAGRHLFTFDRFYTEDRFERASVEDFEQVQPKFFIRFDAPYSGYVPEDDRVFREYFRERLVLSGRIGHFGIYAFPKYSSDLSHCLLQPRIN